MAIETQPVTIDPTRRESLGDFVNGKPAGYVEPSTSKLEHTAEHVLIEDRPEHAHMFPPYGVHVPNVARYPSGFRDWHNENPKSK